MKTPTGKNAREEDEEKKASSMDTGADGRQTQLVFVAGVVGPALGARPVVPCQGATGARVGCPPSSDGVQGWLLRCAVDAGWSICVASRSHSSVRGAIGVAGGRRTLQAANLKSTRLGAKALGNRRFLITGLFYSGMLSFINIRFQTWSSKHALELCSLFANVSVLLSRVRGARDLIVPRYALRHIVDFPRRGRPLCWYLDELGQLGS